MSVSIISPLTLTHIATGAIGEAFALDAYPVGSGYRDRFFVVLEDGTFATWYLDEVKLAPVDFVPANELEQVKRLRDEVINELVNPTPAPEPLGFDLPEPEPEKPSRRKAKSSDG